MTYIKLYILNSKHRRNMERKKCTNKGRPRLGGPGGKTVLFTLKVTADLRARLKAVSADDIRGALERLLLWKVNLGLMASWKGETLEPGGDPAVHGAQGIDNQAIADAGSGDRAPQGSPGGPAGSAPATPTIQTGWAAGNGPALDTKMLFTE